jgi:hypothetical protein
MDRLNLNTVGKMAAELNGARLRLRRIAFGDQGLHPQGFAFFL